jgi:hypothetical protein
VPARALHVAAGMDPQPERPTYLDAYACENCFRRCIWVREPTANGAPRCLCGAILELSPLPSGVYEVVDTAAPTDSAKPPRVEPADARNASIGQEADIGYGESHGYGPGHGGPTGPGDAPAGDD